MSADERSLGELMIESLREIARAELVDELIECVDAAPCVAGTLEQRPADKHLRVAVSGKDITVLLPHQTKPQRFVEC